MLTHQQILHFSTFGYLTLRGHLRRAEQPAQRQVPERAEVQDLLVRKH